MSSESVPALWDNIVQLSTGLSHKLSFSLSIGVPDQAVHTIIRFNGLSDRTLMYIRAAHPPAPSPPIPNLPRPLP